MPLFGDEQFQRSYQAQFIQSPSPEDARKQITETRDLLEKHGRTRDEIKFFQGLSFVVGSTEAEAREKERELEEKIDADGMVALGLQLHTPTAEVVGPNWVVNTSPAFADEVVDAIGGQVITKANAQGSPEAEQWSVRYGGF